jgi:mono/diheme cytochrome c family protein
MKRINSIITVITVAIFMLAFTIPQDQKKPGPWEIPSKYQKMENPYKDDASLEKVGKMLWAKHCKSCHGNMGIGDGPKAKQLETFPGDFSTEDFQKQTDGVLYYKSFIGRDEMPNFEKKITDEEDRWAIINFIRTM